MVSMRIRADSASGTPSRSKMSGHVQRLPEYNPRRIGMPLRPERGLCDSFEELAFLVRVADLPSQPESGVVVIKRFAVPARSAMHSAISRTAISCWDRCQVGTGKASES